MKVIGIKFDWNRYVVLPPELVNSHLIQIISESRIVDNYNNKVVDDKFSIEIFETTELEGWDKPVEVIEIESILAENNRLQRELTRVQEKLDALETVATSTDLVV